MLSFELSGVPAFNLDWWAPTQKEWAPVLLADHKIPWRSEREPTLNTPWKKLTPKYAKAKQQKWPGQPILRASGFMEDHVRIKPRGTGFEAETTDYGIYHQFGTSKMVARPWLGIPDTSLEHIVPISWKNILSKGK